MCKNKYFNYLCINLFLNSVYITGLDIKKNCERTIVNVFLPVIFSNETVLLSTHNIFFG